MTYRKEEHQIFRKDLRRFLEKEAYPFYDEWEKNRMIPRAFWRKMGQQGFLCPFIDEKYGGLNTDFGYSAILIEELERVGASLIGVSNHNEIVVPYIHTFGTEEQKAKWLPGCISGEIITAIAMTEPDAGSDLANIKTTAVKDRNHYNVNGQKTFITNGIQADLILLACKTDMNGKTHKGISLLLVEGNAEGFKRGKKLDKIGLHSQDTAELIFEDVKVPMENLLGEEGKGFYYMMEKLQQERLVVALAAQIAAERMFELTIQYTKERHAFKKRIMDFQNTQFKLAEMATEIELGRTFVARLVSEHIHKKDIVKEVSMAKWWNTEMAKRVASQCIQLFGGYGYMEDYEIARRYRDIPIAAIYAGTNEIMKVIIAKKLDLNYF